MKSQTVPEFVADMNALALTWGVDNREVLDECKPILLTGIEENFDESQSSALIGWPARKDPKPQHPLLILTGSLKAAATGSGPGAVERNDGQSIELGVDPDATDIGSIKGARRHQFGDLGMGDGILARPYMGIREETAEACENLIADRKSKELVN